MTTRLPSANAKQRLAWLLLGIFAWVACVCPGQPFEGDLTRTEPTIEAVAGTYVLTWQTVTGTPIDQLTAQDGTHLSASLITLHEDGTVEAANVPRWVPNEHYFDWTLQRFVSGEGRWSIIESDSAWRIVLVGTNLDLNTRIWLGEEQPPHTLLLLDYHPDPDSGQAMVYTQQAKPGLPKSAPPTPKPIARRGLEYGFPMLRWVLFWVIVLPLPSIASVAFALLVWALLPRRKAP